MSGQWSVQLLDSHGLFFDLSPSCVAAVVFTALCVVLALKGDEIVNGELQYVIPAVLLAVLSFICGIIIWRQPQSNESLNFKVRADFHFI